MKIQKRDIRSLAVGIQAAERTKDKYDQHFTYALGKNRRAIRDEVEALAEAERAKLEKYNEATNKLSEECAKMEGVKVLTTANGVVLDDVFKYNKESEKLSKEFKKDIDENNKFFKEEIKVDIHLVSNKYFPDIDGQIGDYLFPMRMNPVEEEKEEAEKLKAQEKKEKEAKKKQ